MRLRPVLLALLFLLLAGCGGGKSNSNTDASAGGNDQLAQPGPKGGGSLSLELSAQKDGAYYRVNLHARNAADLYQLAGTLSFDSGRYSIVNVEAGGGLGGPQDAYFLGRESSPGKVDFAYTKRAYGPGASGDAWLISVIVDPQAGALKLSDFSLDQEAGKLLLRDSKKKPLKAGFVLGGVQ